MLKAHIDDPAMQNWRWKNCTFIVCKDEVQRSRQLRRQPGAPSAGHKSQVLNVRHVIALITLPLAIKNLSKPLLCFIQDRQEGWADVAPANLGQVRKEAAAVGCSYGSPSLPLTFDVWRISLGVAAMGFPFSGFSLS